MEKNDCVVTVVFQKTDNYVKIFFFVILIAMLKYFVLLISNTYLIGVSSTFEEGSLFQTCKDNWVLRLGKDSLVQSNTGDGISFGAGFIGQ